MKIEMGRIPILAQAVALMRGHFTKEPIVFWMSKAKSVVGQFFRGDLKIISDLVMDEDALVQLRAYVQRGDTQ
ncbi:hypothetical protein ACRHQP_00550 [Burkholderia pseudomallei]|uniref:hypothetical protein n=1 Tax=Burkholderia pseudomallei TaxID=28450 RepID=UPI00406484CF